MKMVMIVYNEALDMDVMEMMANCGIKNYTKVNGVFGRGESSGTHLGDDIWPGRNNILYVVCKSEEKDLLLSGVKELRKSLGKEGVKAFSWMIDEIM